jgi:hypothetical protein
LISKWSADGEEKEFGLGLGMNGGS